MVLCKNCFSFHEPGGLIAAVGIPSCSYGHCLGRSSSGECKN